MSKRSKRRRASGEIPNHSRIGFHRNLRKSGFSGYVAEMISPRQRNVLIPQAIVDDLMWQAAKLQQFKYENA